MRRNAQKPGKIGILISIGIFFKPRSYNELNSDFMHEFILLFYFPSN